MNKSINFFVLTPNFWRYGEKALSFQEDSARQVIFSGVVQELSKRNLVGSKMEAHYKVSQNKVFRLFF